MADFRRSAERVERELIERLTLSAVPVRLADAMRYSVLNGGKRIRATLVYLGGDALGLPYSLLDSTACAVEMVHAYSLIHDDLPAMDDDDTRRGKPSCHIAFDEATAILAGDALQTLGFEVIASDEQLTANARTSLLAALAEAIGGRGMVAGQVMDMALEGIQADRTQLESMHALKTGALIRFSAGCAGHIAATDPGLQQQLFDYGTVLGLAFQVRDDILDVEGDEASLGKPTGSDAEACKSTFVSCLGMDASRRCLSQLLDRARELANDLGSDGQPLYQLAEFVAHRNH